MHVCVLSVSICLSMYVCLCVYACVLEFCNIPVLYLVHAVIILIYVLCVFKIM